MDNNGMALSGIVESDSERRRFVNSLYRDLLERAIRYFFPGCTLDQDVEAAADPAACEQSVAPDGATIIEWLGRHYRLADPPRLTAHQQRLVAAILRVLSARYAVMRDLQFADQATNLFRGLPEDRYISAFLDPTPFQLLSDVDSHRDRVTDAIEVLRISSLSTYENRRIVSGTLLYGREGDSCHPLPAIPPGALQYEAPITSIRSFHRISDGFQTVSLVDPGGRLIELAEIESWARPFAGMKLPVPVAARYRDHCRATLCGGHTCLVLTPNGEIKVFAEGRQVFGFLGGRWRLTDSAEKYERWRIAMEGAEDLAELLFRVALDMAEERKGGLLVVLDEGQPVQMLLRDADLLTWDPDPESPVRSKAHLHYLLRDRNVLDVSPVVLETVARMDGAIVVDRQGQLLSFGAILRTSIPGHEADSIEGGRTLAALLASHHAAVLKISEDGLVSFFRQGKRVWDL